MKKCKIFFGNPSKVETDINEFFSNILITCISVTQSEHVGLNECTYLTVIIIYSAITQM